MLSSSQFSSAWREKIFSRELKPIKVTAVKLSRGSGRKRADFGKTPQLILHGEKVGFLISNLTPKGQGKSLMFALGIIERRNVCLCRPGALARLPSLVCAIILFLSRPCSYSPSSSRRRQQQQRKKKSCNVSAKRGETESCALWRGRDLISSSFSQGGEEKNNNTFPKPLIHDVWTALCCDIADIATLEYRRR